MVQFIQQRLSTLLTPVCVDVFRCSRGKYYFLGVLVLVHSIPTYLEKVIYYFDNKIKNVFHCVCDVQN